MVKNGSKMFQSYVGDRDIAGRTGDSFTMKNGDTIQIVGYTNAGREYLVKQSGNEHQLFVYIYREK